MNRYVVIDLEMCKTFKSAQNRRMNYRYELIQIGAVVLDENYKEIDSFVTYVSPEFGKIDGFINQLTGISREDTRSAPTAKLALEALADRIPKDATIVAWSQNDEHQIRNEMMRKGFDVPRLSESFGSWTDCQQIFGGKLNTNKRYKLSEALSIADIFYDEGAHDALVDARNTARLFAKLQSKEELVLSPYFIGTYADNACPSAPFSYCGCY